MGSNLFFFRKYCFEPIYEGGKGVPLLFTLQNTEFFYPQKGLEGYLCLGSNILGIIYNIDTPFCTSDQELLTFE